MKVRCDEKPVDEQHRPEQMGTLYYGIKSFLKFKVVDMFGNLIHQLEDERYYDVKIGYSEHNFLYILEWEMRSGTICANFLPRMLGERQMVVRLDNNRSHSLSPDICQLSINILYAPCSPSLTLTFLDDTDLVERCTAGEEFRFEVKLFDVFGNPVLQYSDETYDIDIQAPVPKRAAKQHKKEQVVTRKIKSSPKRFAVAVCFKIAGPRKLRVIMNSGSKSSFKDISVEVLPSAPDHLNDVRFTTDGAVDESFSADPTVMYRDQWSLLEGRLVDCYDNDVGKTSNDYNISLKLFNDKEKETEIENGDSEIGNKTFRAQVLIKQAGKHNLVITLTNTSCPDQVVRLKEIPIQVNDAPLYLSGSEFRYPKTCVAGKEIQLEVLPLDVFGRPLPNSTTNCNLTGQIQKDPKNIRNIFVQTPQPKSAIGEHKKEQVNIKRNKTPENLSFAVTVCFKKAGHREARLIINSGSKSSSKEIHVEVLPSAPHYLNDVRFTTNGAIDESFSADPTVMYRNQWSLLEAARIFDSYDNVVHELSDDFDICLKLSNDKGEEMKIKYKDEEIRNERFRVQVKIHEAGKHNLLITLTSRRNPYQLYRLKEIPIQVNDAPLYLSGSEFRYPKTCVAGKEIKVEVLPLDVFGRPLPANSTTNCNLTGQIQKDPKKISNIFVQAPHPKSAIGEHKKEQVNIKMIKTPENLSFAVTVCFKKAGLKKATLNINPGSKSSSKEIHVEVLPSVPHYFNDVRFTTNGAIDESFSADPTVMYRNQWSSSEAARIFDSYDNVVRELSDDFDIGLKLSNDIGEEMKMEYKDEEIRNERFRVQVKIHEAGKHNLLITLTSRSNPDQLYRLKEIPIQVNDAPLYLSGSEFRYPKTCVAGKEIQLEVLPLDVFGRPLPANSTTNCNLTGQIQKDPKNIRNIFVQTPHPKSAIGEHKKEQVNIKRNKTPENLSFAVTVCFKKAGHRKARLIINSGSKSSSKEIHVEVLPSVPHYLNHVRFTTNGAIDESFSADPTVMYRNQWSSLEAARVFDSYDNVVRELSDDFDIGLKLSNDKGEEMKIEYKDEEIRNERFRVQVKIHEAGKHNLLITLTSKSNPDQLYRLKEIQIKVDDAPLYLAGSQIRCPDTSVAGKEIQLKIFPVDVFGCPLPADSTANHTLTCDILDSCLELNENKETIDFTVIENKSNIVTCVSIVLTKAGSRKVIIFDKNNKQNELSIHVKPDINDVHWEIIARKDTAYRRGNLIITIRLCDRFNNEVRTDILENIPDQIKRDGPDGLHCTRILMENNKATINSHLKQAGKYDFCLTDRDGTSLEGTSFSITVQDAPLDYHRSTIEWIPKYDDIPDEPVFSEDETFQCCLQLTDVVGYDYDTKIEKNCIKLKYGNTEVKNIKVSPCANYTGSYNIVVPLKNLVKDDPSPQFWCFVNGMKIENSLTLPTFEGFERYNDDWNCDVKHRLYKFVKIVCRSVRRNDIIGSDFCHLNNVKRVCNLCDDPEVQTCQIESIDDDLADYGDDEPIRAGDDDDVDDDDYDDDYDSDDNSNRGDYDDDGDDDIDLICTVITLPFEEIVCEEIESDWILICPPEEIENKIQKCRNILLHLLRAIYYREEASELDKAREKWKDEASKNYKKIKGGGSVDKNCPRFCSQIKEKYARLMRRYHEAACEEIFQFFNAERGQSEIDLHGLLVVDERKLRDYERQLCFRGHMSLDEVDKKIKEERDHGNEAIRYCMFTILVLIYTVI